MPIQWDARAFDADGARRRPCDNGRRLPDVTDGALYRTATDDTDHFCGRTDHHDHDDNHDDYDHSPGAVGAEGDDGQ
jgi:hypothetical protein